MARAVGMPTSPIRRLRTIGIFEGLSFLILLGVAMPLKYFAGIPEAVKSQAGYTAFCSSPCAPHSSTQTGSAVDDAASRACCHRSPVAFWTVCYRRLVAQRGYGFVAEYVGAEYVGLIGTALGDV